MLHARPRAVPELVDAAFNLVRARPGVYATGAALMAVPFIVNTVALLLATRWMIAQTPTSLGGVVHLMMVVSAASTATSVLITIVGSGALLHVASRSYVGDTADLGAGLGRVRQRLGRLLLLGYGKYVVVFGLFLVMTALLAGAAQLPRSGSILILLALVALPLAALVLLLMICLSMTGSVVLIEDAPSVAAAIRRSLTLTRGALARLAGVFVLAVLIAWATTSALALGTWWITSSRMAAQVIADLGWSAFIAFGAALVAVTYYDLRIRHEGLDLELLAERLPISVAPRVPAATSSGQPA